MQTCTSQKGISANDLGFTLIELIIVIVLLGILGTMGSSFISQAFKGFSAANNRREIYEEGKTALVKLEREIRNAIPNAINLVSSTEFQIGMINEVAMQPVFGRYTESAPTNTITDETVALANNSIISIYNRNWSDFSNSTITQRRLYRVSSPSGAGMPLDPTFKPTGVIASSPSHRFYAVDKVVRYYLDGSTLRRSKIDIATEDEDLTAFPADSAGKPLAKNIKAGSLMFDYTPSSLTRSALVIIQFVLAKGGEEVPFHKEVHIRNVP